MTPLTVGVLKETAPGERRVGMVPETVGRLRSAGFDVMVQAGAGARAWFPDSAYAEAGATIADLGTVLQRAEIVVTVQPPDPGGSPLRPGQVLVGLLQPLTSPEAVRQWAKQGVTAVSLDMLPRTLSRAQGMDALTSQASVAGYKAVLVAADAYGRYLPLLMTAAGTAKPAQVLILGAGVAGLQAIGTARRLGAQVTGYDIRPEARGEITSLGGKVLDLGGGGASGSGEGGYARALSTEEAAAQQQAIDQAIGRFDIVITTAQVPGRKPPVLVSEAALAGMKPGSVVLDMAASALGGNVVASRPDETVVLDNGVTVIGAGNLPAAMPTGASAAYARNIAALLGTLVADGAVHIDRSDEIQAGVVITHNGAVVNPAVAAALGEPIDEGPAGDGPAPAVGSGSNGTGDGPEPAVDSGSNGAGATSATLAGGAK